MADNVQNINGIAAMGARAQRVMAGNGMPQVTGLEMRNNARVPIMIDQGNAAASRAQEKKELANTVQNSLNGAQINIAYDLKDDIEAIDEEKRYRAAITFMEWIIQTYNDDSFSMHVMFEKHPFLREMVNKTIDYWCDLVRKTAIAKLMPRTLWDEGIENLMFRMYTMSPQQRRDFIQFINQNPFYSQSYPQKDPIKRGPFSMRTVLNGVSDATKNDNDVFSRAAGGVGRNNYSDHAISIRDLMTIGRQGGYPL